MRKTGYWFIFAFMCIMYGCNNKETKSLSMQVGDIGASCTDSFAVNQNVALAEVLQDTTNVSDGVKQSQSMEVDTSICEWPDIQPSFPGGPRALVAYLGEQTGQSDYGKKISKSSRKMKDLKVIAQFMVDTDGSLKNIKIHLKKTDPELEKKVYAIISGMPKWNPAQDQGKVVRCIYWLPIQLDLE